MVGKDISSQTNPMNRHFSSERFLLGCLLVALMVGIVFVKFWIVSVEERLAESLATQFDTDKRQNNFLWLHEERLRVTEHISWAVWDHHAPCDGWPTQQQIAEGPHE